MKFGSLTVVPYLLLKHFILIVNCVHCSVAR